MASLSLRRTCSNWAWAPAGWRGWSATPRPTPGLCFPDRAINLVFHGHSVPAGYHRTPEVKPFDSYPHLLAVRLKERFPHADVSAAWLAALAAGTPRDDLLSQFNHPNRAGHEIAAATLTDCLAGYLGIAP